MGMGFGVFGLGFGLQGFSFCSKHQNLNAEILSFNSKPLIGVLKSWANVRENPIHPKD